ncbi:GtrA family protein [Leekyejoonella antrihumi]|uniref:GtrA family protein n=1 Tax=Leekyejoonella antrihumi TaxID=1660198 RepID=UPI001FE3F79E|nr:GtrA family protein [Leekyejoonella antrihumi]
MIDKLRRTVSVLWRELVKFGIIGVVSFVIDLGGFNWLVSGSLEHKVTTAKIISGGVATVFSWVGNRFWTFRHRHNRPVHHEAALFFAVNGVALAMSAGWVAFAHYLLNAQGALWLNINAFIGIALGTLFRFWTYRRFVFVNEDLTEPEVAAAAPTRDTP